jgi:putative thioredoxin
MADSPWIFTVTEADFETKVLEASHKTPVVVDFWATWCEPCKVLGPVLEQAITDRKGEVLLAKIDADQESRLAMYWNIEGLPTVLAFKGGKPVDEFVGNLPAAAIGQFLDRLLPTEADRKANAGNDLEQSDPAKAEQIYRDALAKNPNQESATVGLARLLIQKDRDAEAAEFLEQLGPGSEQGAEVERLNALLWLRKTARDLEPMSALRQRIAGNAGDAGARYQLGVRLALEGKGAEALEMLYSAGEKDAKLASTRVREAMVKVFQIVGNRSPLADDYRARLTSLLY